MAIDKKGVIENGHAWVEVEGRPFEEPDDVKRYQVTFRYPPAARGGSLELL